MSKKRPLWVVHFGQFLKEKKINLKILKIRWYTDHSVKKKFEYITQSFISQIIVKIGWIFIKNGDIEVDKREKSDIYKKRTKKNKKGFT